jgi:hypothetical protein
MAERDTVAGAGASISSGTGMASRIVIGRFTLRAKGAGLGTTRLRAVHVEASALPDWRQGIVWLTRTAPAPRQALGYVLWAHAPGAHLQSYVADMPEATAAILLEHGVDLWRAAAAKGSVQAEEPLPRVRLKLCLVDGHRIDATLTRIGLDAVGLAFRDLEPDHIGSVTGLDGPLPHFTPVRAHAEWATEEGRPERLIAAAAEAYRHRPQPDELRPP